MKMLISIAAPTVAIPETLDEANFQLNDPSRNKKYAEELIANGKPISILGHQGYEGTTPGFEAVTAVVEDRKVRYVCQWQLHTRQGRFIVQRIVWQDPDPRWRGFARKMIDWFLEKYDYLVLSDTQYPKGVKMYQTYIRDNVDKRFIYLKYNEHYYRIKDIEHFNTLVDKIWSKNQSHKNVRVLIATKPLTF